MYRSVTQLVSVLFEKVEIVTVELCGVALKLNHTALIANQHHIPFVVMLHLKKPDGKRFSLHILNELLNDLWLI